ncbi:Serine/threonine-protein kinase csk1 [Apiospora kogelbergensis]|uniref:cyclin-dependent kinase n=1 Tax=Apiospora kogelbergensis TaxID=1337665 RepID=A0AAW0QMA0_9PEZI
MSSEHDWRSAVSSLDRYENIQKIKAAIEASDPASQSAQKEAFSKENEAYKNSASIGDYNAICCVSPTQQQPPSSPPFHQDLGEQDEAATSPGISIGSYHGCHHVAGGVTAEVYRAQARALKVITETRDIAPHDPFREAKILASLTSKGSSSNIIPLLETFRDQEQRFVLVFPYMPLSLESLLARREPVTRAQTRRIFGDIFAALKDLHARDIVHRDIKPSAVLLESPDGPAYLSDFGTAWHPAMSVATEPADGKILDIGTGPYRAPEVLFGDKAYGPPVDMWGAGAMLAECCREPPRTLFESRAAHEDGNQLGLILSIFQTIGSPTRESWPEAAHFRTPPFEMYRAFDVREWPEILPEVESPYRDLVSSLVKYDSSRASASEALDILTTKCH